MGETDEKQAKTRRAPATRFLPPGLINSLCFAVQRCALRVHPRFQNSPPSTAPQNLPLSAPFRARARPAPSPSRLVWTRMRLGWNLALPNKSQPYDFLFVCFLCFVVQKKHEVANNTTLCSCSSRSVTVAARGDQDCGSGGTSPSRSIRPPGPFAIPGGPSQSEHRT